MTPKNSHPSPDATEHDLNPEQKQAILQARALLLATEITPPRAPDANIDVLEFMLTDECYAIETQYINEVYPLKELTPLPCTPSFVAGIINLRGRIISVIDIKRFFDIPPKGISDLNKIILLQKDDMEFGILADRIIGTQSIALNTLQDALPTLTGIRSDYLKGITPERHIVLDAAKLLSDTTIIVEEEVTI
jgi:purine-binding chemotaxis protein CheW